MPSKHKAGGCGCCTCDCNDVRLFYGFTDMEVTGTAGPVTVFPYLNEVFPTTWPGFTNQTHTLPTSGCFAGFRQHSGVQTPYAPGVYPPNRYRVSSSTGYPFYNEGGFYLMAVELSYSIVYNCYFFPDTYSLAIGSYYYIWTGNHPVGAWNPAFTVNEFTSGGVRYKWEVLPQNFNVWLLTASASVDFTTSVTSVNLAGGGSHPYDILGAFVGTVTVS